MRIKPAVFLILAIAQAVGSVAGLIALYLPLSGVSDSDNTVNWDVTDTTIASIQVLANQPTVTLNGVGPGTTTATAFVDACFAPQTAVTVKPKITGSTSTLWWFNGQSPSGYTTSTTLTANPAGAGSYSWSVSQTGTKVTLGTNGQSTMQVTSAGWSSTVGDVSMTVTVNGIASDAYILTVRGPKTLQAGAITDSCDATYAYLSIVDYTIIDNLLSPLPSPVPLNEFWASSPACGSSYPSCNWIRGPATGFTTTSSAPSSFGDHIQGQANGYSPLAVGPSGCSTGVGTAVVQFWGQDWRVGSTSPGVGLRVQTDSLQKYIDHAKHNNIITPYP